MEESEKAKSTVQNEMIEKLKALGSELPAATELVNLQTNNVFNDVFSEPGP